MPTWVILPQNLDATTPSSSFQFAALAVAVLGNETARSWASHYLETIIEQIGEDGDWEPEMANS